MISRNIFGSASNQNVLTFFRDFTEADLARRKSSFSNDYTKITKYNVVQYFLAMIMHTLWKLKFSATKFFKEITSNQSSQSIVKVD